ncbi:MAG TPA: alanine dehydrogenase, partial [Burkholderiaceae bacterium]|nr:alanine dehydrogenase [Burkholderiaceae bacterium]
MLVGVPKEIKVHEYRVGLTPSSVREMKMHGHTVLVQTDAGAGIGATDDDYGRAGAEIAASAEEVFKRAEMIVKVKEPQAIERAMLREGQILFTYLHLAPDPEQAADLLKSGAICIAYETVTAPTGGLPLLAPMSEVAGRLSVQAGARCLEKSAGGMGMLLGGVAGVAPGRIVILGAGMVGINAAQMAVGTGAEVTVIDISIDALRRIDSMLGARVKTVFSNRDNVEREILRADLVISGVLIPGAEAPKLVTRAMLPQMKRGSVIVDVAIDQGGSCETSRPTTHADPTYVIDGVVHYMVANMPGAVPRTSTYALNNATLSFALQLANKGWRRALSENPHLKAGLN